MTNYSLSFWNLLKETKTDKNKFVREASLACLKKFGDILKESPEVMELIRDGKSYGGAKGKAKRGIKKKGKNKAFFNKNKDDDNPKEKGAQKRRKKKGLHKPSSKELFVKANPGIRGSNSGRLETVGRSRSQGKKESQMRGKIINKKMNLKNVKGRLNIQELKKQFAKKNKSKEKKPNDEIEIAFIEPAEKIDYEKWMNEDKPAPSTLVEKIKPKKLHKKRAKPQSVEPEEPAEEGFEINIAMPKGPNPYAKKREETIPDQFSEEETEQMVEASPPMEMPARPSKPSRIAQKRLALQEDLENKRHISPRRPRRTDYREMNQATGSWAQGSNLRIGTGNNEYRSEFRGVKSSAWSRGNESDQKEEINKFKTYVKLLNKRIKEMNQEMKSLKEENKHIKRRLDQVESMAMILNTTMLNRNLMGNQPMGSQMQIARQPQIQSLPIQNRGNQNMNNTNLTLAQPQVQQKKNREEPKKSVVNEKKFGKKKNINVIIQEEGDKPLKIDPYKNDYMSPIEKNDFNFKEETTNLQQEFMLSKEPSQIQKSWKKGENAEEKKEEISEEEMLRLESMIQEAEKEQEDPQANSEAINNLIFEILSSPVSKDQLKEKYIWRRFLDSQHLMELIILLEKTILLRFIMKLIDLEITAQLHNDMDLLGLLFRWLFELISLPQFEEELFVFLDSDQFKRENRYFDDSQLDMSEICVNSTDISSIIRDNRLKIGFKVWKTTIFTISAYENEEIMEHCHKIISYMRQKSIGSERTNAMTDITEEANGKGTNY